jgi:hypothetical protein
VEDDEPCLWSWLRRVHPPKGEEMPDLRPEEVRASLRAQGLEVTDDDLPEVTHRVNAMQEALEKLEHPDLDAVEPLPVFWLQEES